MSQDICKCCGQKIRLLNPHRMDKSKVRLLEQIAKLNLSGVEWVKVQRDGNLIKPSFARSTIQCDDVHALRLTWFGLLESKAKRTGKYKTTESGFKFLKGKLRVPAELLCKDGIVFEQSALDVSVNEVRGVILDRAYWNDYGKIKKPVEPSEQPVLI